MRNLFVTRYPQSVLVLCMLLVSGLLSGQTYQGDLTLTSQDQIDNFNYTAVNGNLDIFDDFGSPPTITNLSGLSSLTSVSGNLSMFHLPMLTNLDGLSNLTSIGGNFDIFGLSQLANLNGLSNLTSIGGNVFIGSLPLITQIDAFSNLTSLPGSFNLSNLEQLADLNGLSNLSSIGDDLRLGVLPQLSNLAALSNLSSLGDDLFLSNLPQIQHLNAFTNLSSIGGLYIFHLNQLANLDGLSNVTIIDGEIAINTVPALADIDGLQNVTTLNGRISFHNASILTNLDGLQNVSSGVTGGNINTNAMLEDCCAVLPFLGFNPNFEIYNNAPGCNSKAEVNSDCNDLPYSLTRVATACTGGASYDTGTQVLSLSGTGCYYTSPYQQDELALVETELCGDGEIIIRINSISSNAWAGVIMRESDNAGSKKVALALNSQSQARRESRKATDGAASVRSISALGKSWLRLVRTGDVFIGYFSANGQQWSQALFANIAMDACIRVGLFVTNRAATPQSASVDFGQLHISGGGIVPLASGTPQLAPFVPLTPAHELDVYPNPSTGRLVVELGAFAPTDPTRTVPYGNGAQKEGSITLFDMLGRPVRLLHEGAFDAGRLTYELSDIPAGVYKVRLRAMDGTVQVQQWVKQ